MDVHFALGAISTTQMVTNVVDRLQKTHSNNLGAFSMYLHHVKNESRTHHADVGKRRLVDVLRRNFHDAEGLGVALDAHLKDLVAVWGHGRRGGCHRRNWSKRIVPMV